MQNQSILALDYGEKKIGVAFKNKGSLLCEAIGNVKNQGDVIYKVFTLCKTHSVDLVLIGYPLSEGFGKNRSTFKVEKFAKILRNSLPHKIQLKLFNERFTTKEAQQNYFNSKGKKTQWQQQKDTLSAKILLERFLLKEFSDAQ